MPTRTTSTDYEPAVPQDKTARPAVGRPRADGQPQTVPAASQLDTRPGDMPAVEEFLQLLGRSIHQFHTYPATSPLCTDAIAACHKALASLERRDGLTFRVTPRDLVVNEWRIGAGTIVEHEVARRLHRAHIAALDIECTASPRDLSRFSTDVLHCDDLARTKTTLTELLAEHGVQTITAHLAHRPEVLEVGIPRPPLCALVDRERGRRAAANAPTGPVSYLYPPDKGWVRLDPSARFETMSLVDLAILVDDPAEIASMLLRLTDDEAGTESRDGALQQKFSDVSTLFASLDPHLARLMFSKLARAVLELEPDRRRDLLRRTVLPGLLDGRAEGTVLRDFPDDDLAGSLCLLMDLETAAPGLLTTAMDRLELPTARRQTIAPLLESRLRGATTGPAPASSGVSPGIDRHVRRLIQIEPAAGKNFAEFAAFDLAVDDVTRAAFADIRESIGGTDVPVTRLGFLLNLVRLQPNPTAADAFLRLTVDVFAELERSRRQDIGPWASQFRALEEGLRPSRPDVADAIVNALVDFCTPDRAMALADLYATGAEGKACANAHVAGFAGAMVPGFLALLDDPARSVKARALVPLMCEHNRLLAPSLALHMRHGGVGAVHAIARVLGLAGPGFENVLAEHLQKGDERTSREALQALAHIGSLRAALIVASHVRKGSKTVRAAAEEALRHFPPPATAAALRELLGNREFVVHHPETATRLLDRALQLGLTDLESAMRTLVPLRFRFWNPAVVRVALKARTMIGPH
jgi:HEAT repeat protein